MRRIATTHELTAELEKLVAYAGSRRPSRTVVASQLRGLSTRVAMEFQTDKALKTYLDDHPDADRSKHTIKKDKSGKRSPDEEREQEYQRRAVVDHLDFAVKALKLHPLTHSAVRDFKKAISRGTATKRERDELVEYLESDAQRLHGGKKDNASKKQVKTVGDIVEFLKGESTTKHLT